LCQTRRRKMTSEKRRVFPVLLAAGILFLVLDGFLIFMEYGHYQQKYQMAALLLEEDRTDLHWEHLEDDASHIKDIYMQMESLGSYFEQLKEAAAREKENTKSMVTDISHQLKTPMAALKACLEILDQEDLTEEERKEFLRRCRDQMTGLEQLSSALIQISRMETGMITLHMEEKRIFDTVLLAVNRIIPKAEDKKIEI